jgi:hypothetical protein
MRRDYRAKLTKEELDRIPTDNQWDPSFGYFDKLFLTNAKLPKERWTVEFLETLTKGQQIFVLLASFDGQVKNGGITQFLWNCPDEIFPVRDAIEYLGEKKLLENYERALENLLGKKESWLALREQCYQAPKNPKWESFQATYDLLDLSWFDDAYFDKCGYDSENQWVVQGDGLHRSLAGKLIAYVKDRPEEFIED